MRSVLKTLSILFPWQVLGIILFPFLVGLMIDFQLVELREILILIIWVLLFTLPFYFTHKRLFYYLVLILAFVNGFVNLGHWLLMQTPIAASSIFVFFNTTVEEAVGFAELKSSYLFLWMIPYVLFFIYALVKPPKPVENRQRTGNILAIILGLVALIFLGENLMHDRLVRKGTPTLVRTVVSFNREIKEYQKLKAKTKMNEGIVEAKAMKSDKSQLVVLIIGESTNRNHMSLYGYERETSPKLEQFKDLVVYDNVVSAFSNTLKSIPASLSQAGIENELKAPSSLNLTQVFRAAGFKTYWLSNQSPLGVWDNIITLFAEQSEVTKFVNVASNSSFESTYRKSFDEKLFQPLTHALEEDQGKNKFIILHLMGSHSTYETRYPSDFEKFKEKATHQDKIISAYDNSILYNDYIVDSLFKIVADYCDRNQILGSAVYVSDHGENVYDEGDYAGRNYKKSIPKSNVEIPFIVWHSEVYKNELPEKVETIQAQKHLPFVTDDLLYAILDLSNIKTPIFEPSKSVFNKQFDKNRIRILEDGLDYDQK